MNYRVYMDKSEYDQNVYARVDDDGLIRVTCIDKNPEFQQWLTDNIDNLPDDIQKKIDDGELKVQSER